MGLKATVEVRRREEESEMSEMRIAEVRQWWKTLSFKVPKTTVTCMYEASLARANAKCQMPQREAPFCSLDDEFQGPYRIRKNIDLGT